MILQCSECKARYLVPDASIGKHGRNVRCAKCAHTWFQHPNSNAKNSLLGDLDVLLNEINTTPHGHPGGGGLPALRYGQATASLKLSAIAAFAVTLALAALFLVPGLFGLPHSKGLRLADVGMVKSSENAQNSYQITGTISNTTQNTVKLPTLRITLIDADGNALQYWDFSDNTKTLDAGKAIPFASGDLEIRFSKASRFVVELGSPLELALRRKPG